MELSEIFKQTNITVDLTSRTKEELFEELIDFLASRKELEETEEVREALWERERMLNTVVAPAIALPHASLRRQTEGIGVFGVSHQGIDYGDTEGEPVHIVMLLIDNRFETKKHLRALRSAAALIGSPNFYTKIMRCTTPGEVHEVIVEVEEMQRV